MPSKEFRFTKGFFIGASSFAVLFLFINCLLVKVGEIDLPNIIEKQQINPSILFSSGINQNVFAYKLGLIKKVNPRVITIGSSRAMQMRRQFFKPSFINLGGTVSNVSDLEELTRSLVASHHEYEAIFLFIDPWWFNPHYPLARLPHSDIEYPSIVNLDLVFKAMATLRRGNWPLRSLGTVNLGIHSILTGEGFSADGSYHYTGRMTSSSPALDAHFANTLKRIKTGSQRFEKSDIADQLLVNHACDAIKSLHQTTTKLIIVAPPFSSRVWGELQTGGYGYITEAYTQLQACLNQPIIDFSNPDSLEGATDCEFADGFHGGDTITGRMLLELANTRDDLVDDVDVDFIKQFIAKFSGHAAGMTATIFPTLKETDFLEIGCQKI